jgi:hypothetical protein
MFKKALFAIAVAVSGFAVTARSAQADSVTYQFSGVGAPVSNPLVNLPATPVGFVLSVPSFVNPPFVNTFPPNPLSFVSFTCAQMESSTNCRPSGNAVTFSNQGSGPFTANLSFAASNNATYIFFFPTGAFGTPGVYTTGTGVNSGTLTVMATATAPEPSSLVLLLAGLLCCGLFRLRGLSGIGLRS